MKESFSSEIGEPPGHGGDSFSNEFLGASESLIERDRPPRPIDIGRRSRRIIFWLIFTLAVLGGGGWSLWYWSEEVGEWIASWNPDEAPAGAGEAAAPAEPAPAPAQPATPEPATPEPATPEPPPTPTPAPAPLPGPIPGELPVEPLDTPDPIPGALPVEPLDTPPTGTDGQVERVSVVATSVRGRVADSRVSARLGAVDEALAGCWTTTVAAAHGQPASVTLRFSIKWNGRLLGVRVDGDGPAAIERCITEALPTSGWPQPSDGGEASVSREWRLR